MENGLFPAHLKFHGFCNMIKQDIDEPLAHVQCHSTLMGMYYTPGTGLCLQDIKPQEAGTAGCYSSCAVSL